MRFVNKKILNKIAIIIPAYNEEKYIEKTIKKCLKIVPNIIVIDDGSKDLTYSVAKNTGVLVKRHKFNRGKGVTLRTGFNYALKRDFTGVITLDADSQHNVDEIIKFIDILSSSKKDIDIILGNRMDNPKGMPLIRFIANKFTSWLISKRVNRKIPDAQSGFRYISKKVLKNIKTKSNGFEAESELLLKASLKGYEILSIPISTIYHKDIISNINPIREAFMFFKLLIQSFLLRDNKKLK